MELVCVELSERVLCAVGTRHAGWRREATTQGETHECVSPKQVATNCGDLFPRAASKSISTLLFSQQNKVGCLLNNYHYDNHSKSSELFFWGQIFLYMP